TRFRREADLRAIREGVAPSVVERPSSRAGGGPPELDELCVRALAPRAEDRLGLPGAAAGANPLPLRGRHRSRPQPDADAARPAAAARRQVAAGEEEGAEGRVEGMREAMRALALDAGSVEAQKVLIEVLTGGAEEVPPAARPELEEITQRRRGGGVRVAMW